jgi:outer membrane murein-binding lipoprotein Lpp
MSVDADHAKTDGGDPPSANGGGTSDPPDGAEDSWESVPSASQDDTVQVEWSDLRAMRSRIEDLDGEVADLQDEVARLEGELEAMRRQHEAAIDRYEQLLAERATDEGRTGDGGDGGGVLGWIRGVFGR